MPTANEAIPWGKIVAPSQVHMDDAGVQNIIAVYTTQLSAGLHPGSQLVVLRHGGIVIDPSSGRIQKKKWS